LDTVSTTRGSGWVSHTGSDSIAISHVHQQPTRYRGWYWLCPTTTFDSWGKTFRICPVYAWRVLTRSKFDDWLSASYWTGFAQTMMCRFTLRLRRPMWGSCYAPVWS